MQRPPPPIGSSSASSAPSIRAPLPPSAFPAVTPAELSDVLSDTNALILDIRPHAAYAAARIPHAVSLSVPSTLLKRPLFSLARLAEMLPGPAARAQLARWPTASRIVVYDADTAALAEGNVVGLMRKFRAEGFPAERQVAWLRGGFHAVVRNRPDLVDTAPVHDDEGDADEGGGADEAPNIGKSVSAPAGVSSFAPPPPRSAPLRTKRLPMSAFTHASTLRPSISMHALPEGIASTSAVPPTPMAVARADPFNNATAIPQTPAGEFPPMGRSVSTQSGHFSLRMPMQRGGASSMPTISPGHGHQYPALGPRVAHYSLPPRQVAFNPFFDSIRQNIELAGGPASQRGTGIQLRLPRRVRRRVGELPFEWLREIARRSGRAKESDSDSDSMSEDSVSGAENVQPARTAKPSSVRTVKQQAHTQAPVRRHPLPHEHRGHGDPLSSPPSSPTRALPPRSRTSSGARPSPLHTMHEQPTPTATQPSQAHQAQDDNLPGSSSSDSRSPASAEDLTRELEMQFYKIELGEQRRLMGVMERHSKDSGGVVSIASPGTATGPVHSSSHSAGSPSGTAGAVELAQAARLPKVAKKLEEVAGEVEKEEVGVDVEVEGLGVGQRKRGKGKGKGKGGEEFPFSITAGLEKGSKNRYRYIWPFEHARVRLRKIHPEDDDYMNASHVQPLGTTKRYIATQGPLPATYIDFWKLCWEQNVHVIVMLTREIEGASVKCGKYWADGEYGPLRLRIIETNDSPERERRRREAEMNGGFFSAHIPQMKPKPKRRRRKSQATDPLRDEDSDASDSDHRTTIRRVFELTHSGYPAAPPRIVTQLQYLEWPDMNVPEDPRGVLRLMRKVEDVVDRARKDGDRPWGEGPLRRRAGAAKHQPASSVSMYASATPEPTTDEGGLSDDVDPVTGIAKHAKGNAPVLLHCSAGVGRTGGYIAVDAVLDGVRRDIRKRREAGADVVVSSVSASASLSTSGSAGRSSPNRPSDSRASSQGVDQDAMDVDSNSSPPGESVDVRAPASGPAHTVPLGGLTMPVLVGGSEVHVPVAGFAGSAPMDVDGGLVAGNNNPDKSRPRRPSAHSPPGSLDGAVPALVLSASPALVEEVRRASLNRWPSTSTAMSSITEQATPMSSRDSLSSSSGSVAVKASSSPGTTSGWASTSDSMIHGHSRSSVSPPTSNTGSSASLSGAMQKTANLTLRSSSSPAPSASTAADSDPHARAMSVQSSLSSASDSKTSRSTSEAQQSSRLDTWRSEVRTSGSPPHREGDGSPPATDAPGESTKQTAEQAEEDGSTSSEPRTYNFALPRRLHDDSSPPLLSTYDEPIRRVIEDMREQRMSLCQSLRQYVFVHRAIIEGALMIVDEEKAREREEMEQAMEERAYAPKGSRIVLDDLGVADMDISPVEEEAQESVGVEPAFPRAARSQELGHSLVSAQTGGEAIIKGSESGSKAPNPSSAPTTLESVLSPGKMKRGASPTELQQDAAKLSKRPSVKRKQRSDDDGSLRLETMSMTSASGSSALPGPRQQ
ncbi:hypothetical protein CERSUDRAFT_78993 [Gelatoporia subvermispora B]|uniref:protein-tyrosine-phosphatase n=1 Tax=Ceriporiopsis subvermispora (strain B) TaxID=914234 RepID=M2RR28_CERS8|nr:hypothetical protein CERSUDRAFT_78993 [Gelatoporia subvermispora B]